MAPEKNLSILLLDDEPFILKFIRSSLENAGYANIRPISSGEAALAAMEEAKYDLLLSDVFLPEIDGRDVADRFLQLNPGARVLLMTGFAPEELDLPESLSGRVGILEKPFSHDKLVEALAREQRFSPPEAAAFPPQVQSARQTHLSAAAC